MFQSTPSRRGRHAFGSSDIILLLFQSTPSRRGRPSFLCPIRSHFRFNPLPHAEGDRLPCSFPFLSCVSIHSLTQRETVSLIAASETVLFQSTPSRRGRRKAFLYTCRLLVVSIHSLTQRETSWAIFSKSSALFQSTPSRRGRPPQAIPHIPPGKFQSTPSRRGRRIYPGKKP